MTERTRQSGGNPPPPAAGMPETDGPSVPQPVTDGCMVFRGPHETKLFGLVAAKHAIILESKGLRNSRFRCGVRGLWAKHYGMPPRSKPLAVIARIQEEIDSLSADPQQELPL